MTVEIASLERVRTAADLLRRQGSKPTADRVIELIGGGSKTTVLEHLRALRIAPVEIEDCSPAVYDLARPLIAQIFRMGRDAESDKIRAATSALSKVVEEQDAQIVELGAESERLERVAARQSEDLAAAAIDIKRLTETEQRLRKELEAIRVTDHSNAMENRMREALDRVEAFLENARTPAQKRPTITLPTAGN